MLLPLFCTVPELLKVPDPALCCTMLPLPRKRNRPELLSTEPLFRSRDWLVIAEVTVPALLSVTLFSVRSEVPSDIVVPEGSWIVPGPAIELPLAQFMPPERVKVLLAAIDKAPPKPDWVSIPKTSTSCAKVRLPVRFVMPENVASLRPILSGALIVAVPRFTTPPKPASVSASSSSMPPPDVVMSALTSTLFFAAAFRVTPDCMVTAALKVMLFSACSSTVPVVNACSEATLSVPLVRLSGSANARSGSPGAVNPPSREPAPACTVILSGSRSRVPPVPCGASSPTVP